MDWGLVGGLWGARAVFGGLLGLWVLVAFGWGRDGLLVFGLREVESVFALFRSLDVFGGSFAVGSGKLLVFVGFFGRGGCVLYVHFNI